MQKIKSALLKFYKQPAFTGFVLFIIVLILNLIFEPPSKFFSLNYINSLFVSNTPFLLVTLGQGILMLAGLLDCSIGMQVALVNVIYIMTVQEWGIPFWMGMILGILGAVAASSVIGALESFVGLPAFLCSYAMTTVIKGVNVLIMPIEQGKVPKEIYKVYHNPIGGVIPTSAIIFFAVLIVLFFFSKTKFWKHIYAVGGNRQNAYAAGIDANGIQMKASILKGVVVGVAGISLTLMSASGNPIQCEEYGMRSLAACIMGGMGWGGWGSVACATFGGWFYVLISNFVYYLFTWLSKIIPGFQVSSYYNNLAADVIVFLGLLVTVITIKRQRESLKQGIKEELNKLNDTVSTVKGKEDK